MRVRRLAVSVAWLAAFAGAAGSGYAQSIPVTVGGAASSVVGTPFDVPIVIDMRQRTEKLGSFALTLRWNPAVLQLVTGVDGQMGPLTANDDSIPQGVVKLTAANPAGLGGLITVAIGRFKPLVTDTTTFRLAVSELYAAGTFANLLPLAGALNRGYCPARGRYGDVASPGATPSDPPGPPDGTVDSFDALVALMSAVGLDVSSFDIGLADVDGNNVINPRDALIILSYAVGLDVSAFRVNVLAAGATCAGSGAPTFALIPGSLSLVTGQQAQYLVLGTDTLGAAVSVPRVSWTSSAPGIATVDSIGHVTGVAAGSATITAFRDSTIAGTATVTVVASRKTHWVDALAIHAMNQLGTSSLPFGTIQEAIDFAKAGDTVRVRSGRYPEADSIGKRIVLVGDTSAGGSRPVIAGEAGYGLTLSGGKRVDVIDIVFDTLYQAIYSSGVDTLRVRNVDIRSASAAAYGIYVDSIGALRVEQSRFTGAGRTYQYSDDAVYVSRAAGLVVIDSSRISDYGYDAVYVNQADSMLVRGSWIHDNYGYGVDLEAPDSTRASHAAFVRNRFKQNSYGQVYLDTYARAAFDHNVMSGTGYNGITLYGFSNSLVTLHGDSIAANNGLWISAYTGDSLFADSLAIRGAGYYWGYLTNFRSAVVRDSRFNEVTDYAIETSGTSTDTMSLVLRNVAFTGPDLAVCDQCGEGVDAYYTNVDMDSVSGQNLDYLVYTDYGDLALRHSSLNHGYYVAETYCGSLVMDSVNVTDSRYGVDAYGCLATDSAAFNRVTVTSPQGASYGYGIYASSLRTRVQNSSFDGAYSGVEIWYGPATVQNVQMSNVRENGVTAGPYGSGNVLVSGVNIACGAVGASSGLGIAAYGATTDTLLVQNNTVTGCYQGIGVYRGAYNETRGNTISTSSAARFGIAAFPDTLTRVVGNTVSGPTTAASIWSGYNSSADTGNTTIIDSNIVTNPTYNGIFASGPKVLMIRGNQVTGLQPRACCGGNGYRNAAIYLGSQGANAQQASVLQNRIVGSAANGIVMYRTSGDTVTILVDSNTVKGADSVGVWVDYYATALVRKNAIDSTGMDAVRVSNLGNAVAPVINQNNFTRSGGYGVYNTRSDQLTVDATNNWWGDAKGPSGSLGDPTSTGDSVSALVTFSPWSTTSVSTLTPAPAWLGVPVVRGTPSVTGGATLPTGSVVPVAPRPRTPTAHALPQLPAALPRVASPTGVTVPAPVVADDAARAERVAARRSALEKLFEARAARRATLQQQRQTQAAERAKRVEAASPRGAPDGGGQE